MKALIFAILFMTGVTASAQSSYEDLEACVSQELKLQIRAAVERFEVTAIYQVNDSVDMIVAIHSGTFIGQGFVEIRNSDFANSKFLVEGLKPQPLNLTTCF